MKKEYESRKKGAPAVRENCRGYAIGENFTKIIIFHVWQKVKKNAGGNPLLTLDKSIKYPTIEAYKGGA